MIAHGVSLTGTVDTYAHVCLEVSGQCYLTHQPYYVSILIILEERKASQKLRLKLGDTDKRKVWFSSDWHVQWPWGLVICNRPFPTVVKYDEHIIKTHNSIVGKDDYFFFLGDFAMNGTAFSELIPNLNGRWYFIVGNHDKTPRKVLEKHCHMVADLIDLSLPKYHVWLTLTHYEMVCWDKSHYGAANLFGHYHNPKQWPNQLGGRRLCVSSDLHDFKPWGLDEVIAYMAKQKRNWDTVPQGEQFQWKEK